MDPTQETDEDEKKMKNANSMNDLSHGLLGSPTQTYCTQQEWRSHEYFGLTSFEPPNPFFIITKLK